MTEATAKSSEGNGEYKKKKPLYLRAEKAQAAQERTIQYVTADIPGGQVQIRELTINGMRMLESFQKKDDGTVDKFRTAIAIAMFMCYDPDTGKPAWENTPKRIAWFEGLPISVMRVGGWLYDIDQKAAEVMTFADNIEDVVKNSEPAQSGLSSSA